MKILFELFLVAIVIVLVAILLVSIHPLLSPVAVLLGTIIGFMAGAHISNNID